MPQDDLISALVRAHEAGDQLSEAELFSTMVLLIVAGHETTVNLIGNAVLALLRQPEIAAAPRAGQYPMEAAVEEFLRYDSPVERALVRWAAQDTVLGGQQIKQGDMVIGVVGAANRDPSALRSAGEARPSAWRRNAIWPLATVHTTAWEHPSPGWRARSRLNTLLRRLPNLRLAVPESELVWRTVPMFRGLVALPVTWT